MISFASIPVGETFDYGGNIYRKRSTRTAEIVMSRGYSPDTLTWFIHDNYTGVWGYFAQRQMVNQEAHWWAAMQHGREVKARIHSMLEEANQ
jgi:hypothetical protein